LATGEYIIGRNTEFDQLAIEDITEAIHCVSSQIFATGAALRGGCLIDVSLLRSPPSVDSGLKEGFLGALVLSRSHLLGSQGFPALIVKAIKFLDDGGDFFLCGFS